MNQNTIINCCTEILLSLLRYSPNNSIFNQELRQKELIKNLKFQEITDDMYYRSCIDSIEDTQLAIAEFLINGFSTKLDFVGEKYLKLYGVLNACYIQQGAIIDLSRLLNSKNQKEIKAKLKSCKLIEFRNKIGSHPTKYIIESNNKETDFFRLSQFHLKLSKFGEGLLIVGKDSNEVIDLQKLILDFTCMIELILIEIIKEVIFGKRTFKKEHFEWMKTKYYELLQINN